MTQRNTDTVSVFNKSQGNTLVAQNVVVVSGFLGRLRGLMFKKELGDGEGLLLERTSSIHMCFMRFPIDVIFLDKDNKVVKVVSGLNPWTLWCGAKGAAAVLELRAGAGGQVLIGDVLDFSEGGGDG